MKIKNTLKNYFIEVPHSQEDPASSGNNKLISGNTIIDFQPETTADVRRIVGQPDDRYGAASNNTKEDDIRKLRADTNIIFKNKPEEVDQVKCDIKNENKKHKSDDKNDINDKSKIKTIKNQENKKNEKLRSNLKSNMKTAKPMVNKLNKITEYIKPRPDRNFIVDDYKYMEPDTANKGSGKKNFSSSSYSRTSGDRKQQLCLENSEKSLNLPRGVSKAEL